MEVTQLTDSCLLFHPECLMRVLVSISIVDDDGTELDSVSSSGETVDEAIERALEELDISP